MSQRFMENLDFLKERHRFLKEIQGESKFLEVIRKIAEKNLQKEIRENLDS